MNQGYDVAQICQNGHVISGYSRSYPQHSEKFCQKCGAPTITNCPGCETPIRGAYLEGFPSDYQAPGFCLNCGVPYPWTQARIQAAHELAQELDGLDKQERDILEKSIDDLIKDSPSTPVAVTRFKKIMVKVGQTSASLFREILTDVLSETARKLLWP
jgi:hypothetical protein